jgi:hypothetical protein
VQVTLACWQPLEVAAHGPHDDVQVRIRLVAVVRPGVLVAVELGGKHLAH